MSQENSKIITASEDDVRKYAAPSRSAPEASGEGEAAVPPDLETLRGERDALQDKYLRAQAECANITRRLTEEKFQAVRLSRADFARDLLEVVDNFDRTLLSLEGHDPTDPLVQGVKLVYESLMKLLRRYQVEPIEAVGRPFDPALHQAITHEPTDRVPEGHVVRELARGYRMQDHVLRPARVSVARKPDTDAPPAADAEA